MAADHVFRARRKTGGLSDDAHARVDTWVQRAERIHQASAILTAMAIDVWRLSGTQTEQATEPVQ